MVSPRVTEIVNDTCNPLVTEMLWETHLRELQRETRPARLRAAHIERELGSTRPAAWRAGATWLGGQLVGAGERLRAAGGVRAQPVG